MSAGADPGFLKRGRVHLRSTSKKGGHRRGPTLGPMLKSLYRGPKMGEGPDPLPPPPIRPWSVYAGADPEGGFGGFEPPPWSSKSFTSTVKLPSPNVSHSGGAL